MEIKQKKVKGYTYVAEHQESGNTYRITAEVDSNLEIQSFNGEIYNEQGARIGSFSQTMNEKTLTLNKGIARAAISDVIDDISEVIATMVANDAEVGDVNTNVTIEEEA